MVNTHPKCTPEEFVEWAKTFIGQNGESVYVAAAEKNGKGVLRNLPNGNVQTLAYVPKGGIVFKEWREEDDNRGVTEIRVSFGEEYELRELRYRNFGGRFFGGYEPGEEFPEDLAEDLGEICEGFELAYTRKPIPRRGEGQSEPEQPMLKTRMLTDNQKTVRDFVDLAIELGKENVMSKIETGYFPPVGLKQASVNVRVEGELKMQIFGLDPRESRIYVHGGEETEIYPVNEMPKELLNLMSEAIPEMWERVSQIQLNYNKEQGKIPNI